MNKKMNEGPIFSQKKPWDINDNDIWLASTIALRRNIEKFNFPGKLIDDRRKQIVTLVSKEIVASDQLDNPLLLLAEDLDPLEKEYLAEHFFIGRNFNQASSGEAFIIDASGQFLTAFNLDDHLYFHYLDCKGELESSWNKLVKIETGIGSTVTYSFSPKLGFLTADPHQCGTALLVTIFLQVPALIHGLRLDEVLKKHADEGIIVEGIQGNPHEIIGDVLAIKNNYCLGISEENIIAILRSFTTKIINEENNCRLLMHKTQHADLKDKVSRAYGIIKLSYQIEAVEALNSLGLLKLGLNMGWISGITHSQLNYLFLKCRRAHLLSNYEEKIPHEEIMHKRSEFIHHSLKDVQLEI